MLRTDPFSKFITVSYDEVKELPLWCLNCEQEIDRHSFTCQSCDRFSVCADCYYDGLDDHDEHEFDDAWHDVDE